MNPHQIYSDIGLAINTTDDDSIRFLQQSLAQKTDYQDTHPCLTDRLISIGYIINENSGKNLILPPSFPVSAAQKYLGGYLSDVKQYFDQAWLEQVQTPWRQRYAYAQESLQKLGDLEAKIKIESLTVEENWELAYWTCEFRSEEACLPILQQILHDEINHYGANYLLGTILLKRDDSQGVEYIEKAISQHHQDFVEGCSLIYAFYKKQGNMKAAYSYQEKIEQHYHTLALAQHERSYVHVNDQFEEHNLSAEVLEMVLEKIAENPDVKTAYLTQKVVKYFPEQHFYILGVVKRNKFIELESGLNKFINEIVNSLQDFPGYIYVILLNNDNKSLRKKFKQVPNAIIYQYKK